MKEHFIWVEKYRPKTIDELILEPETEKRIRKIKEEGTIPHLFLSGTPGCGKTTAAKVLINELELESIFINASLESNIDILRDKVSHFARTVSFNRKQKVIILDEVDGVTSNSFFPALRPVIEQYSKNCTFIMTANYPEKVPPAIKSRLQEFEYDILDKKLFATKLLDRLEFILKEENVAYDKKIIMSILKKYFPDIRKMINVMQQNKDFLQDENVLKKITGVDISQLIEYMKKGDFSNVRSYIENDLSVYDTAYKKIYDALYDFIEKKYIPNAIDILNTHQYQNAFVIDKGINLMNMLVQIAVQCEFKK